MKNNIRILSIDPGSAKLGWGILDYNTTTKTTVVSRFGTIDGARVYKKTRDRIPGMDKRFTTHEGLEYEIKDLVKSYKPDIMASEDTFFNPGRPHAFSSLTLVINMCRRVSWYLLNKPLYTYAPRAVKQTVAASGDANKHTVQSAIASQNIIVKNVRQSPIESLDEHSNDAIAVGLTFIEKDLPLLLADPPEMFDPPKKEK